MGTRQNFKFLLFVAGESANAVQAIENLNRICSEYLPSRHEIIIVDVLREPERGLEAKILLTPTLLKLAPKPHLRIIGNLSNLEIVLQNLGLDARKI
jgi:circadian clock protein KaiB